MHYNLSPAFYDEPKQQPNPKTNRNLFEPLRGYRPKTKMSDYVTHTNARSLYMPYVYD